MALNIAVPLSGVGDILSENFNLISPISLQSSSAISPTNYDDCRSTSKILCSPIDSESSGISSLDSEEIKKSSVSSSPTDDEHNSSGQGGNTPSLIITSELSSDQKAHLLSPKPKHATANVAAITTESIDNNATSKVEKTEKSLLETEEAEEDGKLSDDDENAKKIEEKEKSNDTSSDYYSIEEQKQLIAKLRIEINGRNILDLGANLKDNYNDNNPIWQQQGFIRYAHLPENNLKMFLENRSQYHRLGANGHLQEYALVNCKCCDFIYPVNGYNNTNNNSTSGNNIINSVKTNININNNGQLDNMIIKRPVMDNFHQITSQQQQQPQRPTTQNHYSSAFNSSLKQQQQQQQPNNINFDNNSTFMMNNLTALNRNVINNQSNNILENIAAALLNTTTNNNNINGLNQKHYNNNNTHHYFNNNNNHNNNNNNFGGNHHYASHSYSYKQF